MVDKIENNILSKPFLFRKLMKENYLMKMIKEKPKFKRICSVRTNGFLFFPFFFFIKSQVIRNVKTIYPLILQYFQWDRYYYILYEFSTSASADGLLLESERQQVSSGIQDSSQYSSQSQQCCSLDSLASFSDIQFQQSFYRNLCGPVTVGITITFMYHSFFLFSGKVQVLVYLLTFFYFHSVVHRNS